MTMMPVRYNSSSAAAQLTTILDEKKFAELFTEDGTYEFAEVQNVGHDGILFST